MGLSPPIQDGDNRRMRTNVHGQPIGDPVPGWQHGRDRPSRPSPARTAVWRAGPGPPRRRPLHGRSGRCARRTTLDLPAGTARSRDRASYTAWVTDVAAQPDDPYFFAVVDTDPEASPTSGTGPRACSVACGCTPRPAPIQVGHIHLSPALQHRRGQATEGAATCYREPTSSTQPATAATSGSATRSTRRPAGRPRPARFKLRRDLSAGASGQVAQP